MVKLCLIHGYMGSGKTTFSKKLEEDIEAIRFSSDEWVVRLYGRNPPADMYGEYEGRVKSLIWEEAVKFLGCGVSVILDFGFWTRLERDRMRQRADGLNVEVSLYRVKCSLDEMRSRVLSRTQGGEDSLEIDGCAFDDLYQYFEPLEPDEDYIAVD